MSQVILVNDNLKDKRLRSRQQEQKIDRTSQFNHWRKNDITKPNPLLRLAGLVFVPVVAFWSLLWALIGMSLGAVLVVFKFIGKMFR